MTSPVLATATRPAPATAWAAVLTLGWRTMLKIKHVPFQLFDDVFRYSLAALMVILLGLVMGFRPHGGIVGVVLAVALIIVFALSLSWMWIIVGMKVQSPESVMTSSFLLLFPLTMASNIFVDPRTMPSFLQRVVALNPVSHLANASRGLMHGDVAAGDVTL